MKVVAIVALLLSVAFSVHGVATVSDGSSGPPKWPKLSAVAHGL